MDGGAWWTTVHGVTESRTWLSDFTLTFHFHALEKEMATHSSVLAWRIPGSGEPGGMPSMGLHRVWHDWSDLAAVLILATCTSNPELFTCYPLCWIPSHIFSHGWVILMLQFSDKSPPSPRDPSLTTLKVSLLGGLPLTLDCFTYTIYWKFVAFCDLVTFFLPVYRIKVTSHVNSSSVF